MLEFRWLRQELSVSFFAQEVRTPQSLRVKRLGKTWGSSITEGGLRLIADFHRKA